jgi:Na+/H+ antiporter NhaC
MELPPLAADAGLWSVLPPLLAIVLAIATREVVFSLFLGICAGLGIYGALAPLPVHELPAALVSLVRGSIGEGEHLSVLVFAFFMGPLIAVMTRAGGANAFGRWAGAHLKSAVGAKLSTVVFGLLFFVDDYFNCLTIGNVMRPVTDKFRISREKLAYFVDATAAPVCVVAPVTTWAVTVVGYYDGSAGDGVPGMAAFLRAIPFNLYPLLSIAMVLWLALRRGGDFGPMAAAEARARAGDPVGAAAAETREEALAPAIVSPRGRVWDLAVPVAVCGRVDPSLNVLALSSILSGGVMGDHCSPISDTTILSSIGSQCRYIDHVRTQLPYALVVGAASFAGYVAAGLARPLGHGVSACVALAFSAALLAAALVSLPRLFPAPAAGTSPAEKVPAEAKA